MSLQQRSRSCECCWLEAATVAGGRSEGPLPSQPHTPLTECGRQNYCWVSLLPRALNASSRCVQGFSTSALLVFGARYFSVCPVQCRMFSCMSELYPLDASSTAQLWPSKCLRALPSAPWRANPTPPRPTCSKRQQSLYQKQPSDESLDIFLFTC